LLSDTEAAATKNSGSAALVVFVTVGTILARLSFEASSIILLVWTYGRDRVHGEHLRIVKYKPDMLVSNGDVLYGKGSALYLMCLVIWLASFIVIFLLAVRMLPPGERNALERPSKTLPPATVIAVGLFFALGRLPLTYSALLAACALAGAFAWAWIREDNQSAEG
jgi:hypothetical protein